MNKKIVFDGRYLSLNHAGIGRYSCELLKKLLPLDNETKFVILAMRGGKFDAELSQIIDSHVPKIEIIEVKSRHYSLEEQTEILKILNEIKPDLVHFPHFSHPLLYRGKFVVTIHDLILSQFAEHSNYLKRLAYKKIISHAAKNSSKILTVSEFVKRDLAKNFKITPSKIVVTYNGIDEKFQIITNPRVLKKSDDYGLKNPYILSVGQWRAHKNLLRLVEAFAKVKTQISSPLDLVFVGRQDPRYLELPAKIKELGVEKYVRLTGFVEDDDLPAIYNNASCFVFPSLAEGFGLPALEAQACGVPVLSSDKTCLPEVLGRGALYFNPLQVEDMAAKISKVLTDQTLRNSLTNEAKKNVLRFDWEETARKTLEVYREI